MGGGGGEAVVCGGVILGVGGGLIRVVVVQGRKYVVADNGNPSMPCRYLGVNLLILRI